MHLPTVHTPEELVRLINDVGMLPFFRNRIPGWSLEECVEPRWWFPDQGEGVWEWKGPVIRASGCAYGKFLAGKAVFLSRELFPDFANYRRCGYDLDALYDDGLARKNDLHLWQLLTEHGPLETKAFKRLAESGPEGSKHFESAVTRLQMAGYVCIKDFVYPLDRHGRPYGWGAAQYSTPEQIFGADFTDAVYRQSPEDSGALLRRRLLPLVGEDQAGALDALLRRGCVR